MYNLIIIVTFLKFLKNKKIYSIKKKLWYLILKVSWSEDVFFFSEDVPITKLQRLIDVTRVWPENLDLK